MFISLSAPQFERRGEKDTQTQPAREKPEMLESGQTRPPELAAFAAGVATIPVSGAAYRKPDSYVRHRTKVLFPQYYCLIPLSHEVRLLWYLPNVR